MVLDLGTNRQSLHRAPQRELPRTVSPSREGGTKHCAPTFRDGSFSAPQHLYI